MFENQTLNETLVQIQEKWDLSDAQMAALAQVKESVYLEWKSNFDSTNNAPSVPTGMETAVPVVSIYRSLVKKYPETNDQVEWLFSANTDFGGNKPIDIAVSSRENLFWISYYLDSKRTSP